MNAPEHFKIDEGYARYCPVGNVTYPEAIDMVSRVIVFSREQNISRLLINITELTGFKSPDTMQRFEFAERFANDAKSRVRIVLVARPEFIDPQRFGITVARNRGLFTNVFTSEPEALAWLMDPNAK